MQIPALTLWGATEPHSQRGGEEPERRLLHYCSLSAGFRQDVCPQKKVTFEALILYQLCLSKYSHLHLPEEELLGCFIFLVTLDY